MYKMISYGFLSGHRRRRRFDITIYYNIMYTGNDIGVLTITTSYIIILCYRKRGFLFYFTPLRTLYSRFDGDFFFFHSQDDDVFYTRVDLPLTNRFSPEKLVLTLHRCRQFILTARRNRKCSCYTVFVYGAAKRVPVTRVIEVYRRPSINHNVSY